MQCAATAHTHQPKVEVLTACHVGHVCGPELEAVEDVCGVDDAGATRGALLHQEAHQVGTPQHVKVHRDLIQQQHLHAHTADHKNLITMLSL